MGSARVQADDLEPVGRLASLRTGERILEGRRKPPPSLPIARAAERQPPVRVPALDRCTRSEPGEGHRKSPSPAFRERSSLLLRPYTCRRDVAASDPEAAWIFVRRLEDLKHLHVDVLREAMTFEDLATGDSERMAGSFFEEVMCRGSIEREAVFLDREREAMWGKELVERFGVVPGKGW